MSDDTEPPDEDLAARAKVGDQRAFDRLMRRHKAGLYRLARRHVGDADDAYDIVQASFIAAWRGLAGFDRRRSFAIWLRAIALNKCRDHGRRQAVRQRLQALARLAGYGAEASVEPAAAADQQTRQTERERQLEQAIVALPAAYKEPLLLTLVAGMTQAQAAEQLGITAKAVELRLRRARHRLTRALIDRADEG